MAVPLGIPPLPAAQSHSHAGHLLACVFCCLLPFFAGKAKSWSEPGAQLSETPLKEQVRQDRVELRAAAASRVPSRCILFLSAEEPISEEGPTRG